MGYVTVPKGQKPQATEITSPTRRAQRSAPRISSGVSPSIYKGGGPSNPAVPLQNLGSSMLNRASRAMYGRAAVSAAKEIDEIDAAVAHPLPSPLALGPASRPHGGPGWASGPTYGRPPGVLSNSPTHHDQHHDYDLGNKHVTKYGAIDATSTVRPRSKAQQAKREFERHPQNPTSVWESRESTAPKIPPPASSAAHMILDTTAYEPLEGRSRTSNRPPPQM